jgi:hypothetical protein
MSRQGTLACCARKSSLREFAASLMISRRRSTASCLIRSFSQASGRRRSGWRHPGCQRRARRPAGSQLDRLREDGAIPAFQPASRDDVNGAAEQFLKLA